MLPCYNFLTGLFVKEKHMLAIKKLIIGLVIGALIGLWVGVNLGKGKPVWSNPFGDKPLKQQAKDTADEVVKDTKRALREKLEE